MIRIVLVDDQRLVRAGLRMVLDSQPDLSVVAEAGDGEQAVLAVAEHDPDVVLMDIRMPVVDGIEATRLIIADRPQARVIVLTTFDLDEYALQAVRAGASGFLLKDAPPEELLHAVRTVYAGDAVIAAGTTRRLLEHLIPLLPSVQPPTSAVLDVLTARERETLVEMARGYSNTEIAGRFFVSEGTVKTHVGRVLAKLGVRDRVQAVVLAYETGLVRPGDPS